MAFTMGPTVVAAAKADQRRDDAMYGKIGQALGEGMVKGYGQNERDEAERDMLLQEGKIMLGEGIIDDKEYNKIVSGSMTNARGVVSGAKAGMKLQKQITEQASSQQELDYATYLQDLKQAEEGRATAGREAYTGVVQDISQYQGGVGTGVLAPDVQDQYQKYLEQPGMAQAVDVFQQTGQVMSPEVQERYFGKPGMGMDPSDRYTQVQLPGGEYMTIDKTTGQPVDPKSMSRPAQQFEPQMIDLDGDGIPDAMTTSGKSAVPLPRGRTTGDEAKFKDLSAAVTAGVISQEEATDRQRDLLLGKVKPRTYNMKIDAGKKDIYGNPVLEDVRMVERVDPDTNTVYLERVQEGKPGADAAAGVAGTDNYPDLGYDYEGLTERINRSF